MSEVKGSWYALVANPRQTGRSASFRLRFRFVRACVRASGRGEAARGRESGDVSLAGPSESEFRVVRGAFARFFVRRRVGFQRFCPKSDAPLLRFCVQACGL